MFFVHQFAVAGIVFAMLLVALVIIVKVFEKNDTFRFRIVLSGEGHIQKGGGNRF